MTPAPTPSPSTAVARATSDSDGAHRSPFPPIASYAFLSDCESNCLISPTGATVEDRREDAG